MLLQQTSDFFLTFCSFFNNFHLLSDFPFPPVLPKRWRRGEKYTNRNRVILWVPRHSSGILLPLDSTKILVLFGKWPLAVPTQSYQFTTCKASFVTGHCRYHIKDTWGTWAISTWEVELLVEEALGGQEANTKPKTVGLLLQYCSIFILQEKSNKHILSSSSGNSVPHLCGICLFFPDHMEFLSLFMYFRWIC